MQKKIYVGNLTIAKKLEDDVINHKTIWPIYPNLLPKIIYSEQSLTLF